VRVIESREGNPARAEGRDYLEAIRETERERAQAERRAIDQECLDRLAEIDEAARPLAFVPGPLAFGPGGLASCGCGRGRALTRGWSGRLSLAMMSAKRAES